MTRQFFASLFVAFTLVCTLHAQQKVVYLYNGAAPGTESWTWDEATTDANNTWRTPVVYNVTKPSLTVFTPEPGKANGTAVIICPGGGFVALAIGNEGFDVAKWLVKKGVTCFVLKYRIARIAGSDPIQHFNDVVHGGDQLKREAQQAAIPLGIADGRAAIAYVRAHAKEYNINPARVGIMGFSAGGTVSAAAAFNYNPDNKPNFVAPVYAYFPKAMQGAVASDAPPIFIAVAANDPLQLQPHSVDLFTAWNTAGKDAELHVYNQGGHGFGMRVQNTTSDRWIETFAEWLNVKGWLKK